MRSRLARWIVDRYPRGWRERYRDEVRALLDEGRVTWTDVVDLLRGSLSEWKVALADPEHHPRVFEFFAAITFVTMKVALLVPFVLPPLGIAWYLQNIVGPPPDWVATLGIIFFLVLVQMIVRAMIRDSRGGHTGKTPGTLSKRQLTWWVPLAAVTLTLVVWMDGIPTITSTSPGIRGTNSVLIIMWYLSATHRPQFMNELASAMGGRRYLLRWANMELARCLSLSERDPTRARQLASAQAEVDRLNRELQLIYAAIRERRPLPSELTQPS